MNILALDTTHEVMGICIKTENGRTTSFCGDFGLQHSTRLMPCINELLEKMELKPVDLNLIVCAIGPGSFTGLRIGLSTAKGLAMGLNCPLVGVSSLETLAFPYSFFEGTVVPVIDARKKRIFTAFFRKGDRLCPDRDLTPPDLVRELKAHNRVLLTGPMAKEFHLLYPEAERTPPGGDLAAPAALAELGLRKFKASGGDGDTLTPLYLRQSEAELKRAGQEKSVNYG